MRCCCCDIKLDTKDCSCKKGLTFFGICSNCKVVSKLSINLDTNKIDSVLAEDDEIDLVKNLFEKKNEELTRELEHEKDKLTVLSYSGDTWTGSSQGVYWSYNNGDDNINLRLKLY